MWKYDIWLDVAVVGDVPGILCGSMTFVLHLKKTQCKEEGKSTVSTGYLIQDTDLLVPQDHLCSSGIQE